MVVCNASQRSGRSKLNVGCSKPTYPTRSVTRGAGDDFRKDLRRARGIDSNVLDFVSIGAIRVSEARIMSMWR
jgi:hypothetical protein